MRLHDNEVPAGVEIVRALLREQRPDWSELALTEAGSGTENTMYRLGEDMLVRLPRTPNAATAIAKEQRWLPRLAEQLSMAVPEPLHRGQPGPGFPLVWSVFRWIDGKEVSERSIEDWGRFALDLVAFVRELHAIDLMDAKPDEGLRWYRGGSLSDTADWIGQRFEECREIDQLDLDLDQLETWWREAMALPEPTASPVWLHGDLKPSNLVAHDGRLQAVIDFGALSIGLPDAEHAPVWDLPKVARDAYWRAAELDDQTWLRARGWAIAVAISGVPYYWSSNPSFVAECVNRLHAALGDGESS